MPAARRNAIPFDGGVHVMYGLSCSYFTGKLQAYFQTKGLPYRLVKMSRGQFRACARATGFVQLPCVETPDGTGLRGRLGRPASVLD